MLRKDFWYDLPKELIAQEPANPRDSARLMVLHRGSDSIEHRVFRDLTAYLMPGDLLVVNNSKTGASTGYLGSLWQHLTTL